MAFGDHEYLDFYSELDLILSGLGSRHCVNLGKPWVALSTYTVGLNGWIRDFQKGEHMNISPEIVSGHSSPYTQSIPEKGIKATLYIPASKKQSHA